jgi:hypothetical protein
VAPTQRELIQNIHETVVELRTILLGIPGTDDTGLVGEVRLIKMHIDELDDKHKKLSNKFWILVSALVGSGVLGTGIYGMLGK